MKRVSTMEGSEALLATLIGQYQSTGEFEAFSMQLQALEVIAAKKGERERRCKKKQ